MEAVLFYLHAVLLRHLRKTNPSHTAGQKGWTNISHVHELASLPRITSQRWVFLSDESQWYTSIYPDYNGINFLKILLQL